MPLVALNLCLVYVGYRSGREQASQEALNVARGLALALEGELHGRTLALEVLAGSDALARGDLDAFRSQAEALVARQAPGANILLLRADGQQLMNTAAPRGAPLPSRIYMVNQQQVLRTGQPSTSDLFFGIVVHRPVIAIDVPVPTPEGAPTMVLALNPPLDAFDALIRRQQHDPTWIIAVADRVGTRVARIPDPDRFVGRPLTPDLMERWMSGAAEGLLDGVSPDGVHVLTAFVRLPEPYGWGVAVAVPKATLTRPALRTAVALFAAELALLALGLLLARRIALGVLHPITDLLRFAATPDGPTSPTVSPTLGLPEADRLAEALLAEARLRRAATASLVDSERRLRLVVAELNHRAKNALATVQSLALQTARTGGGEPRHFIRTFTARLQSLARAHDLLTAVGWEGAALDAVVRTGLAPWLGEGTDDGRSRFVVQTAPNSPMPQIPPGQVQALIMGLHELAVNAVKHGALSVPDGHVEVICRADPVGLSAAVDWREMDGPPVPGEPARRGFGTRLLERALARDLGPGARVVLMFEAGGLRATICFTPRSIVEAGSASYTSPPQG
ncbi:sensor histidine kinase [Paracraurococcus lichenis]|uniref:histidine kinase n=1 Tax=Paracraurococcus lichenis TaxID=3064888 RepID=A0ABT9EDQ9_9PROT|nr:sensor histidine kinase [Paracraurococcus sp. LOR1-02]MDO9714354.1 sensor histidine kinase [Paracraurococcus sp. LOR1-02]